MTRSNSRLRLTALVPALLSLAGPLQATAAPRPLAIRTEKVEPQVATPDTVAHFGCELRGWSSGRLPCYGPETIRKAYAIDGLIASGTTGAGETIVIIDAYGSPTLEADLAAFDAVFGLPAPPSLTVIRMPGTAPFDPNDSNQVGWAEESSLDVQWAHAIAPGANIVLIAAKDNYDDSLLAAQNYAIDHHLGHIISESYGESELALVQGGDEGHQILDVNEKSYARARKAKISVYVSAGDSGPESYDATGNYLTVPVAQYPASSPNVTSVGGTNLFFGTDLHADPNGSYLGEEVWNDGYGAGGGGISGFFDWPDYQEGLPAPIRRQLGEHRGYPDVAYNGGVYGGVIVHLGFLPPGANGFYIFGGTSAGAPQWAGLTALANQLVGKPVGNINARLYQLGAKGVLAGVMHDITIGDNSFDGVPGYPALPGYDLATGWGTPNFGSLLWLLASPNN